MMLRDATSLPRDMRATIDADVCYAAYDAAAAPVAATHY